LQLKPVVKNKIFAGKNIYLQGLLNSVNLIKYGFHFLTVSKFW